MRWCHRSFRARSAIGLTGLAWRSWPCRRLCCPRSRAPISVLRWGWWALRSLLLCGRGTSRWRGIGALSLPDRVPSRLRASPCRFRWCSPSFPYDATSPRNRAFPSMFDFMDTLLFTTGFTKTNGTVTDNSTATDQATLRPPEPSWRVRDDSDPLSATTVALNRHHLAIARAVTPDRSEVVADVVSRLAVRMGIRVSRPRRRARGVSIGGLSEGRAIRRHARGLLSWRGSHAPRARAIHRRTGIREVRRLPAHTIHPC